MKVRVIQKSGILPWERTVLNTTPQSPGVYILRSADHSILFVGSSDNLKQHLSSYWRRQKSRLINGFDWYVTITPEEASFLEKRWVREYRPILNTFSR